MINTVEQLYEALEQFGTEPVLAHLNDVAYPATLVALAARFNCVAGGAEIVHAAIEQLTQSAPETPATPSKAKQKRRKNHPAANGGKWIRPEKRLAIYLRDGFLCAYCLRNLAGVAANLRSVDHVIPVALGGNNEADNLVLCCKACNDRKQAQSAIEFLFNEHLHGRYDLDTFIERKARLIAVLAVPLNRTLAKAIIAGTLDLSDVLEQVQ